MTLGVHETSAELMDALPDLGLVACYGTGYERVDLGAARARNIAVTYSPGTTAASVADMAMGLLLASVRRIPAGDRLVRDGAWTRHPTSALPLSPGITGRRLGIYGLGEVGRRIALRAQAFELEVGYHGRRRQQDVTYSYHPTLTSLAAWADFLVISVRATSENRMAVNSDVLAALGPGGHLVNVARGSVVDEAALLAVLERGMLAGAGLDVHATEPRPRGGLTERPDVILTPHIAGATESAQAAALDLVMANLEAFFDGRPLSTPIPR